jgi:hypothetical protein
MSFIPVYCEKHVKKNLLKEFLGSDMSDEDNQEIVKIDIETESKSKKKFVEEEMIIKTED